MNLWNAGKICSAIGMLLIVAAPVTADVGAGTDYSYDGDGFQVDVYVVADPVLSESAYYLVFGDGRLLAVYQETNGCAGLQTEGPCGPDSLNAWASDPVGVPPGTWAIAGEPIGGAYDQVAATWAYVWTLGPSTYNAAFDEVAALWDSLWTVL